MKDDSAIKSDWRCRGVMRFHSPGFYCDDCVTQAFAPAPIETLPVTASEIVAAQMEVAAASMRSPGANAKQEGGSHYQTAIQPWDYIHANGIGFIDGTAIKYLSRWRQKGGVQDLRKAIHCIEKLIEVTEAAK